MSSDNTETSELSNNLLNSGHVSKAMSGDLKTEARDQYIETSEEQVEESEDEVKEKDESTEENAGPKRAVEDGDEEFLRSVMDLIFREGLVDTNDRNRKVCEFFKPEELRLKLADLEIGTGRADNNKLLDFTEQLINHSVKTAHPRFFNQLYGGLSLYSVGGAWISEALNASL